MDGAGKYQKVIQTGSWTKAAGSERESRGRSSTNFSSFPLNTKTKDTKREEEKEVIEINTNEN